MNNEAHYTIGVDHEYIPENALPGDTPGERPDVTQTYCEVMQMGACKLDGNGQEVDVLNIIVQAHRIHTIPPWLSKMTGMTEEKRALGIPFPQALELLTQFIGDKSKTWTFNGDWFVLKGNAEAHGIDFSLQPFERLKPRLPEKGIDLGDFKRLGFHEVCSGGLYKVLEIDLPEIEGVGAHDATHDARSLAYAVRHLNLG